MATLLPERIYEHLRRELLAGEYPPGSKLEYKGIGAVFGVSPTPVREAMAKLASDGFVELIPRAGAIARGLGQPEIVQLYGVREAIETYASAKAAERISAAGLRQLEVLLGKMRQLVSQSICGGNGDMKDGRLTEFIDADLDFHTTIIEVAGNPRLTRLAVDSHIRSRLFVADQAGYDPAVMKEQNELHASIYRALKKRNATKASELTARHIRRSLELQLRGGNSNNGTMPRNSTFALSQ